MGFETSHGGVQGLAHGGRVALGPSRIRGPQDVDEKARDALGAVALADDPLVLAEDLLVLAGDLGALHRGGDGEGQDQDGDRRHRGSAPEVTAQEPVGAVGETVGPRADRQPPEVTPQVVRQLLRRQEAALRLLAQRRHDDVVEVTGELPAEASRVGAAPAADLLEG